MAISDKRTRFKMIQFRDSIWICKKCSLQIQQPNRPGSGGCPQGGSHQWTRTYL